MSKQVTLKIADFTAIFNAAELAIINDETLNSKQELAKRLKLSKKLTNSVVAAKIGYGTIKVNGWWYPVVGGEIRWNDSHQLNTTSLGIAGMFAQVAGLVVKSGYVHIEK